MLHAIRAKNPTATIVGVGYCFGGKHVLLLAKWALQAAVTLHPVGRALAVHPKLC
jgi:dienelactone hydrolase